MTDETPVRRCYHEGITLVKLPPVDPRGKDEQNAIARAWITRSWLRRHEALQPVSRFVRNVLLFGKAPKS